MGTPDGTRPPVRSTGGDLGRMRAKSAPAGGPPAATLTGHLADTRARIDDVEARLGPLDALLGDGFWDTARAAALLHDAGKIAYGFQRQLQGPAWGERHEVLSLAAVRRAVRPASVADVAAGVAFHHRAASRRPGASGSRPPLLELYPPDPDEGPRRFEDAFGASGDGRVRTVQVDRRADDALAAWAWALLPPGLRRPDGPAGPGGRAWRRAWDTWRELVDHAAALAGDDALRAVLLQGVVTYADHLASAGLRPTTGTPLPPAYLAWWEGTGCAPRPFQRAAAAADGHVVVLAGTGTGKTEAGLAWAGAQQAAMPGRPRLVWVLPYRVSIDAMAARLRDHLPPGPGEDPAGPGWADRVGVLHSTTLQSLYAACVLDDGPAGAAAKARARTAATRLFAQRVRVTTPHQLVLAALAGPRRSSHLVEQANTTVVLDELHAYDPELFGRICAFMGLWERLGSRVAVLSATLAPPMRELVGASLRAPVTTVGPDVGVLPPRHTLVLDQAPVDADDSLARVVRWAAEERRSVLVVVNTVQSALDVQRALRARLAGGAPLLVLHSRFRRRDRRAAEAAVLARHGERGAAGTGPGGAGGAGRGHGVVVSTQALEVSLRLDFDRGVSAAAPVEALVQRAGRVNRLGRHPEGPVELRVHALPPPAGAREARPYDLAAVEAAWAALAPDHGRVVGEGDAQRWLERAYDTPWGREWARRATTSRDGFARAFLDFSDPFADRDWLRAALDEQFDTVEVVLDDDAEAYRRLAEDAPLAATDLLVPLRYGQLQMLRDRGLAEPYRDTGVYRVAAPYDPATGMDLSAEALEGAVLSRPGPASSTGEDVL